MAEAVRLALQNLLLRRGRTAFLLLGYGMGVAVMIVLLAVGEALVAQARDERLVGGGAITVLPEGIDMEVMKTGGLGGMFFSIDHARFIYRQLLAAPRLAPRVRVVAPQIEGKMLYLRGASGEEIPVLATGEIPSRTAALGVVPPLARGAWSDDAGDRVWRDPTLAELRHGIDHFHDPAGVARDDSTWAEWHYFNVLWPGEARWAFISYIVGTRGGQLLVTLHEQGRPARRFTSNVPPAGVRYSTTRANVTIGDATVTVLEDGGYALRGSATEDAGGARVTFALTLSPMAGAYFPGAAIADRALVSGYVVPALRAAATGEICVDRSCSRVQEAQAYHDHNWGVWRGVTWEWGAARAGAFTFLYGRVQSPDTTASAQPLFVYLVDSLGFRALMRPHVIEYEDTRTVRVGGRSVRVPGRARMVDVRGDDTLRIELTIDDAAATEMRQPSSPLARPYFIQMKGHAVLSGRIGGVEVAGAGVGFFETYR